MSHLIVLCHLRWNFVFQRPQHLMTRLARYHSVVFVEEPIHSDEAPRLDCYSPERNLVVLTPRTPVQAPGFHDDQLGAMTPLLRDYLHANAIEDYVVWFYTPMALPLIKGLQPRAIVYDCMDELAAFKNAPRQLKQRETALMKMSDVVLTGGPALYEAKKSLHPNVHCLPSAVDAAHFSPDGHANAASPERSAVAELQGGLGGTATLGFYGVVDERLDIELLAEVADARPDWDIVMLGPVVKIDPALLPQRANIHWLGMQSYERLPYFTAAWDICLLPFALNESTRFISPTKTLEYMAAGKPVVSTAVRDVVLLYSEVVSIAHDVASFVEACAAALAETASERAERTARMREIVARYTWDRAAETVRVLIDEASVQPESRGRLLASSMVPVRPAIELNGARVRFGT